MVDRADLEGGIGAHGRDQPGARPGESARAGEVPRAPGDHVGKGMSMGCRPILLDRKLIRPRASSRAAAPRPPRPRDGQGRFRPTDAASPAAS